jgi:carbon starvation protein
MAQIFGNFTGGQWLDLWYHFAIMFEALFILTTLDAGTRVGRYLLQDVLGNVWKPLADVKSLPSNMLASVLIVAGWGYFLIQGVRDPLGGINSLWPLFGIANQLLASIALCLATTVILKMHLAPNAHSTSGRPAFALVTLVPLLWLLSVTMTAGVQKIYHPDPRIGFLSQARLLNERLPVLQAAVAAARATGDAVAIEAAEQGVKTNRTLRFNNVLDAVVAGIFLVLVALIFLVSAWEWMLLLARRRLATLRESEPVWLPEYAVAEGKPLRLFGLFALAFALAKELSGEAALERAHQGTTFCGCVGPGSSSTRHRVKVDLLGSARPASPGVSKAALYVQVTEERYRSVKRCC